MAYRRYFPISNSSRYAAIEVAKRKAAHLAPDEDKPITPATESRLNSVGAQYLAAYEEATTALAKQTKATEAAVTIRGVVKVYISHFVQVFNFGIEREKYPLQDRSFYGLSINSGLVPSLNTESEIVQWGNSIIKGDAERTAMGGAPMANPSTAEFKVVFEEMIQLIQTQSSLKNAYDKAQEKVNGMNEAVDKLILRIWNEINTFYDDHEAASRRRKAREWGVVFVSTDTSNIVGGNVLNLADDKAIAGALVSFKEIEAQTTTDSNGRFSFKTDYMGEATITVEKIGFEPETYMVDIEEDRNTNLKAHLSPKE
ncbi:MAG: carboxypeptidase-like regulatory domain-containing protein [Chitinophagales bacterium]|nr:carboxypeptidase-like regulatory domain-containing protein [Chitinophagales bacterium]